MRLSRAFAPFLVSSLVAACGGLDVRPAADVHLVASAPSPEVDALVATFYGPGPGPDFDARLNAALSANPASGALHEVAAYWAVLHSDDHGAWEHFLMAAADTHNPGAGTDILELIKVNRTRSEILATAEAMEQIAAGTPDPEVRARALYAQAMCARMLGRTDDARKAVAGLGFVRQFQILGAFDNEDGKGLAEAYPPEATIDLARTMPGSVVPVRWRAAETLDTYGSLQLYGAIHPNQGAVAYAAVWVLVPEEARGTIRVSSDVPVAAWVNHAETLREERVQHWGLDNVTGAATFHAGWNEVLVKSAVKTGAWNLALRFTDPAGRPIAGLTTAAAPHPFLSSKGEAKGRAITPATARDAFALARGYVAGGLEQRGLAILEKLLAASPKNPLLRFYTADADRQDRQLERALDLLTAGANEERPLPGFLQARAGIYMEKELSTQAQRDLVRVVNGQPAARIARMELADVLSKLTWQSDRVAVLTAVTRTWPDSSWAFQALAAAREAEGYESRAEEAYRRAIELDGSNAAALRSLRRLLDGRQAAGEVDDVFDRLHAINPTDVGDELARAEHERTRGRTRAAVARLTALSEQSPDHPMPYLRRGQLAEELGDEATAIAMFQKAEERDPKDSWVAQRLEHLRPPKDDALHPYIVTDEQIEEAVRRPRAPKADAAAHVETLLSDSATLLSSDGSVRVVETDVLRALTQRGRDELVHLAVPGGATRVMKAYAETPDGKRQDASSIDRAGVRFRNLDVGSTVVLQYAWYPRRTGALAEDYFRDAPFSALARHIDHMRWVVVDSKQKPAQISADPRVKHTVTDAGAWTVHEFVRDDVPAIPAEVSMVPVPELAAHVIVTTVPSWDSFVRWEKAILDESFPADPAIDALAAKLTTGAATPMEKLGKLFTFTAQEIRYQQEYESILAGWQPHRSSVVLERKYGDCKDKATLLIALARAVGIELRFVTLATHHMGHPDRSVVLPHFNHAIAYVPAQTGIDAPFFLDATVDGLDLWNLRDDDQGAAGLVMDPKTGTWSWIDIPFQAPSFQEQRWKVDVDIDSPEKVTAKSHLEIRGSQASQMRKLLRNDDQSRQVYDLIASAAFPGSRVLSASAPDHESLAHPLAIDQEIDLTAAIRQEGDHFRLKFATDAESSLTKLAERQTPLDLGAERRSVEEYVVHLGKDVRLSDKPPPVDVVDPCFHARRTVTTGLATVTVKDELEQTCTRVSVDDYPRYRAAMDRARALLDTAVVFERAPGKKVASRK